jgi:GntR family transcriptional regulator
MINKLMPVPLYYQVKEDILYKINQGVYQVEDIIPTENELQAMYGVSRITVRRAIQELVQDGYLSAQQGKGTYVNKPKATQELNVITSWAETIAKLGMNPKTKKTEISEEPATVTVAKMLNVEPGEKLYKIERLRYVDGTPVCLMVNYLIPEVVPDLLEKGLIEESLYQTLEKRYNLVLERAVETVEACAANAREAQLLKIEKNSPLLRVKRATYDPFDRVIEVVIAVSRADMYSYTINLAGRPQK